MNGREGGVRVALAPEEGMAVEEEHAKALEDADEGLAAGAVRPVKLAGAAERPEGQALAEGIDRADAKEEHVMADLQSVNAGFGA